MKPLSITCCLAEQKSSISREFFDCGFDDLTDTQKEIVERRVLEVQDWKVKPMSEIPSCTVHAVPMTLKQGEHGKTFWACQWCDNESTERLRSMCESANPADHERFKALHEKREAERYWFYDYLCDGCKARIAKAIVVRSRV